MTDVADALGISRRTVYNYFASTEQLFTAVAELALQGFVADVKSIIADLDVTAQLVEVVAYIIERLPPRTAVRAAAGKRPLEHVEPQHVGVQRDRTLPRVLRQAHIAWAALGYDDRTVDELVEFLLRIIQSRVVAPPETPRSGAELRDDCAAGSDQPSPSSRTHRRSAVQSNSATRRSHVGTSPAVATIILAMAPVCQHPRVSASLRYRPRNKDVSRRNVGQQSCAGRRPGWPRHM